MDSVVSQCSWLGDQVVGVDFHLDDGSNSLSNQIDELAASMNAVSYTHLDVYKRQVADCNSIFFSGDFN